MTAMKNPTPAEPTAPTAPEGGRWITYSLDNVFPDATFKGSSARFETEQNYETLSDINISFYVVGGDGSPMHKDAVTYIEYKGNLFRAADANGAPILDGSHTTKEWLTIDIKGFRLVSPDGSVGKKAPYLVDKEPFQGVHTLTPSQPQMVPCFGPDVMLDVRGRGVVPVRALRSGDYVLTRDGYREVLWADGGKRPVNERNAPIQYRGEIYSPQHRILHEECWISARQLHKAGLAQLAPHDGSQWYGHILLDGHQVVLTAACEVESLLPTERAISGLTAAFAGQVRSAMAGRSYALAYPEIRARDLLVVA
jgi:hypothetical protein